MIHLTGNKCWWVALAFIGAVNWTACGRAIQSEIEITKVEATKYFSSDYKEARDKFLNASHSVDATIESFKNPNTGPEGAPLFIDVALIGPKDTNSILVLVSGTHGVEGFCGSGIQTGLLLKGITSHLKPEMSIVMIHALNPYGFAHLRRFNEDNVDLNRNFVDHSKPYPKNPGYEKLSNVIAPKSLSFPANITFPVRLMWYRVSKGNAALQTAITGGQYLHPQGLFYGGHFETWSNKTIRTIVKRYLSRAARVAIVDFHTGLGPYGRGEIILNDREAVSHT